MPTDERRYSAGRMSMRFWFLHVLLTVVWFTVCSSALGAGGFPWTTYASRPDAWFQVGEGKRIAENVVSHQSLWGSWPKNLDTGRERYRGDPATLQGTFDNRASRGELRFLARAYRATNDQRLLDAFVKGLDHILQAQYPNGGWPQSYPPGRGYARHITFNDGVMVGLMSFLRDVAESEDFSFVDTTRRERAKLAVDKGIQCTLKCQIVVDSQPTAWCAQHDEITLEPRKARSYEHVSISGGESAGVVLFLMSLENPKPEVIRAIDGACRWYQLVQLRGIRQVQKEGDKMIVSDPAAPPLWARFYEIGTNRPIFSGRDGIIRYDMAQIERERRTGYAWYGDWGRKVLEEWRKWKQRADVR